MKVEIINSSDGFYALEKEWIELEKTSFNTTFYSSFTFNKAWWNNHKKDGILNIIIVKDNNKIIAIAPLMIKSLKFGIIKSKVLTSIGKLDYFNFLIQDGLKSTTILNKIMDVIFTKITWDKFNITHIPKGSNLLHFLLKSDKYNNSTFLLSETPVIKTFSYIDFEDFKKQNFRKKINIFVNKAKRELAYKLEIVAGGGDGILNKISEVHRLRNNTELGRVSLFNNPTRFSFLKELYSNSKNTLTFILKNEDGIISYATAYFYNGVIHNWNVSYSPKYNKYSPGDIIYFEMIKYIFEHIPEVRIIDFGGGRYPWKFRMTGDFTPMYTFNINNNLSNKKKYLDFYDKAFKIGKILLNK